MKKKLLAVLMAASLLALAGGASAAAAAPAGKQAQRQARVAGGAKVPLVNSSLGAEQLSAMRPGYRNLRPKARSNVE